jgi:hypothetical protein
MSQQTFDADTLTRWRHNMVRYLARYIFEDAMKGNFDFKLLAEWGIAVQIKDGGETIAFRLAEDGFEPGTVSRWHEGYWEKIKPEG